MHNKDNLNVCVVFFVWLYFLGGSRWAPTHTPAPRSGSTVAATSIGTTRTCPIYTDTLLAFIFLLFLLLLLIIIVFNLRFQFFIFGPS